MARLDRPLYGEYATGTLGRVLAYRHTYNPPDEPGDPVVTFGTVAKIPVMTCGPSSPQISHRSLFAAAGAAWLALSIPARAYYNANKPPQLSGYNLFLRLYLDPSIAYFGYCVFGHAIFQLGPTPYQPLEADYDSPFPVSVDEFPTLVDGGNSPQAWLFNSAYSAVTTIQNYLILHRASIEGR